MTFEDQLAYIEDVQLTEMKIFVESKNYVDFQNSKSKK